MLAVGNVIGGLVLCLAWQAYAETYQPVDPNVSFDSVRTLPADPADATFSYGGAPQQYGEFWLPEGNGAFPVVAFVHGGCWLNAYTVAHSRAAATALRERGFAVWSLEYRRVGDVGGGWPGSLLDVRRGIDYLSTLASRYPLDLDRLYLVGHSAGGHLALLAASDLKLTVARVVGLAAITDIDAYARGTSSCQRAARQFMDGTSARRPQQYAAATKLPDSVAITLVQGSADQIVPRSQTDVAQSADNIALRWVVGAGHFDLIHPGTVAWQALLDVLQP